MHEGGGDGGAEEGGATEVWGGEGDEGRGGRHRWGEEAVETKSICLLTFKIAFGHEYRYVLGLAS